jgi:hypothetical protein
LLLLRDDDSSFLQVLSVTKRKFNLQRMSLEAVNDSDFLLPPHSNIQPLEYWYSLVGMADLLLMFVVAVDSVRCYYKGRTWATFFLARLGVAGFIFQWVNVTSLCFAAWPSAYGIRIIWFMGPLGTLANLSLSIWRVRIFEFVLPPKIARFLRVKYIVPVLSVLCLLSCWPLYVWIFVPSMFASSTTVLAWANDGFTFWINFWVVADVICAVVSLKLVSHVVMNGREVYARRCKMILSALVLMDIFSLFVDFSVALTNGFPYPRRSISLLATLSNLHITLSYFYMVSIVKYIVDTESVVTFAANTTEGTDRKTSQAQ